MKKIFVLILVLSVLCASPFSVSAKTALSDGDSFSKCTYYDDGSYVITTLTVERIELTDSNLARSDEESYVLRARSRALGYDSSDELDWVVTLIGDFLVCPTCSLSGQCQSSTLSAEIYDSSWGMYDVDERCMSNNAYGACSMKDKFLGITMKIVDLELIITCDRYGNLSVLGQ